LVFSRAKINLNGTNSGQLERRSQAQQVDVLEEQSGFGVHAVEKERVKRQYLPWTGIGFSTLTWLSFKTQ